MTAYQAILEIMAWSLLLLGTAIAISAIGAYNHGNAPYAIYAVGSATFCGVAAVAFAIMRATSR